MLHLISNTGLLLNANWSIVSDMTLYIVIPPRRGIASATQILVSHMFGDAGSPYLIGLISDGLFTMMVNGAASCGNIVQDMADASSTEAALINSMKMMEEQENVTEEVVMAVNRTSCDHSWEMYRSLQYSFFSNSGVEVVGGILFLLTAIFIVRDKLACELAVSGTSFDHCLLSPSSSSVLLKFISWCKKVPPTGCRGKVNFEKSTSEPSFDLHRH